MSLLRDGSYLLLLCAQLQVVEDITTMAACEAKYLEKANKMSLGGFSNFCGEINERTHHIATNLIHLQIPVRLALRQNLSSHAKTKQNLSCFLSNLFFWQRKKIRVRKEVVRGNKAYLFSYSKLSLSSLGRRITDQVWHVPTSINSILSFILVHSNHENPQTQSFLLFPKSNVL